MPSFVLFLYALSYLMGSFNALLTQMYSKRDYRPWVQALGTCPETRAYTRVNAELSNWEPLNPRKGPKGLAFNRKPRRVSKSGPWADQLSRCAQWNLTP